MSVPHFSSDKTLRGVDDGDIDMDNGISTSDLLRLIGVTAVCVGLAWALQILGTSDTDALSRLAWVLGAATISGAGVGAIYTALRLRDGEPDAVPAYR